MAEEPDGFLGRWARRKQDVHEGKPPKEPSASAPENPKAAAAVPAVSSTPGPGRPAPGARVRPAAAVPAVSSTPGAKQAPAEPPPKAPPPTLEDVRSLTHQSDFKPYMTSSVDPEVKNAAMRKLFADPHFNVMDGLDIYIDDYNTPNPLPLAMLRQMTSAKVLGLVQDDDKEKEKKAPAATDTRLTDNSVLPEEPANTQAMNEAQAAAIARPAATEQTETNQDADPDLRLQQDHAAGPQSSGGSAQ